MKTPPKRVLALRDLEQAKTAVLNSLASASGQRTYEYAIREFVAGTVRNPASRSTAQSCSVTGLAFVANLGCLMLGFALLSRHFEKSHVPLALPRVLPEASS
jgi:hypothetical protein